MSYGLSPTGFRQKRLPEILADLQNALRAEFGDIGTDTDQIFGQLAGVLASPLADVWEQLAAVYESQYRVGAEGVSLDRVGDYIGLTRIQAAKSRVPVVFLGDDGTLVPSGTQVRVGASGAVLESVADLTLAASAAAKARIEVVNGENGHVYSVSINFATRSFTAESDDPEEIATGLASAINAAAGVSATADGAFIDITRETPGSTFSVATSDPNLVLASVGCERECRAMVAGPTVIPAGTVTDIVTPVSGLDEVTNLVDGTRGRAQETDPEYRARMTAYPNVSGRATETAIKSRLFAQVQGVTAVSVISNRDMAPDGAGRPGKSFEVIISSPGGDNDAIAQAIYDAAPAGIQIVSTATVPENGTAVDVNGNPVVIEFSRPEAVKVWMWVDLTLNSELAHEFPDGGTVAVREAILELGNRAVGGEDIIIQKFYGPIYTVPGIGTATIYLATGDTQPAKPGSPATNYPIGATEIASYAPDRIFVEIL